MADDKPVKRFVESVPGRLAGWLLAALWIYSMSGIDSRAYSAYPACIVLVAVLGLGGIGLLAGYRFVRLSWLGWFTLAAGGYFLVRCQNSYAVVDSWADEAIILGALVYYVAGVYAAQRQSCKPLLFVLAAALVLNILAFWATKQPWFCIEWTGRAQYTPEGKNNVPVSLFIYKNFAGFFFAVGGILLAAGAVGVLRGTGRVVALLVALVCVGLSFLCSTRVPYFLIPIGLFLWWGIYVVQKLLSGGKPGWVNWCAGFAFLAVFGTALYDVLFGNALGEMLHNADSHLRYKIWASVCEILPGAPLWGYGSGATEWEIIPYYNEWYLPNYAHNDYLQVWADYGFIGICLVVVLFVAHVVRGWLCMASEKASSVRKVSVMLAVMLLTCGFMYAVADFPWHSFAFVAVGAFALGVLASPFAYLRAGWVRSSAGVGVVHVRTQKWPGKLLLFLGGCLVATCCVHLGGNLHAAWCAQWEYNEYSKQGVDADGSARRGVIAALLPQYPSPSIMDTYYRLPVGESDIQEQERLLRLVLSANPKQLYTGLFLAEILDRQLKFTEAESLFRRLYGGKDMPDSMLAGWASHYAYHILQWGRYELQQGRQGRARSLLEHALKMDKKYRIDFFLDYRGGDAPWLVEYRKKHRRPRIINNAYTDERLLRKLGIQPDHDWKKPMAPGEPSALYASAVEKISL